MRKNLGVLFVISVAAITPAVAQDANSLLQAADKAMGASAVKSVAYSGTGTIRYPGQSFEPNGDWPRAPMTSYNATIDYGSKSAKEDYAVDVSKKERGGGLAFPHVTNFVSGNYAWNLNPQGQPNPQPAAAELRPGDLGDAGTHQPGAQNSNFSNSHQFPPIGAIGLIGPISLRKTINYNSQANCYDQQPHI